MLSWPHSFKNWQRLAVIHPYPAATLQDTSPALEEPPLSPEEEEHYAALAVEEQRTLF